MGKDYEPMDLSDLDEIREKLLSDPSYNDIEIESTSLEEFLDSIQRPGVKFTTNGGIDELRRRVTDEKKEGNIIIEEIDFTEYHKFKKEIEEDQNLEGRIRKITPEEVLSEIENGASYNLRESLSNLRDRVKKITESRTHDDNTKRF